MLCNKCTYATTDHPTVLITLDAAQFLISFFILSRCFQYKYLSALVVKMEKTVKINNLCDTQGSNQINQRLQIVVI